MSVLRHISAIVLLLLAACASPHSKGADSGPLRAAEPPSDYTLIGKADTSDWKNLRLEANTDLWDHDDVLDGSEENETLSFTFGHAFYWAVWTETENVSAVGDGLDVESPVVFYSPVEASAEIRSALSVVTMRAPDRRNIVGTLLRSPDRRYLLLIEFDTAAGANALYFDITNWAKDRIES